VTERQYQKLTQFYNVTAMPLRLALAVTYGVAVVVGTSAILLVRALATPKD
jgi:hypothetical protein